MKADLLVDFGIYFLFSVGCILLLWRNIELLIQRFRLRHRLNVSVRQKRKMPPVIENYIQLIFESFSKEQTAYLFIISECMIFILSYILSYRNFGPIKALVIAVISFLMPVLFLFTKLEKKRTKASFEGISLCSELLRQYKMCGLNMYEAIEKTIKAEGDYAVSSKWLARLLMRLRSACGPLELRDALARFEYSYQTSWAHMLTQCIRIALEDGSDVSKGIAHIASELKDAEALIEKRKVLNSEASRMTLFMVPIMYVSCMVIAVLYLGVSPSHIIVNQLLNPTGYLLFLLSAFLFLVNMLLVSVVSGYRLDY